MRIDITKWSDLLNQFERSSRDLLSPISEDEMLDAESQLQIILPSDYKSYSHVFGNVSFGAVLVLGVGYKYVLCKQFFGDPEIVNEWSDNLDLFRDINIYHEVSRLVKTGFFFGSIHDGISLYFDLETYSAGDESCDIVAIDFTSGRPWSIYVLGRNFYEFIQNYVFGKHLSSIHQKIYYKLFRFPLTLTPYDFPC
jgi:hypothetical protein